MDILLGWSKKRSHDIAEVLHQWLPIVLPGVQPWMSEKDIDKGTEWWSELKEILAEASGCVISVTKENVRSSWLYFEAGRIAGNGEHVHICPFLVGVGPSSLTSTPLAQYQCTEATKEDTLRLVKSLNKALDESKRHHEEMLTANFESKWPEFEAELGRIMAAEGGVSAGEVDPEPGEGTHQPAAIAYTDGLSGDELYRLAVAVKENTQTVTTGRNDSVAAMLASKGFYQRVPFEPTTRIADIPYTIPLDVWRYLQEHEKELLAKTIESNSKREDRIGRLTGQ